MTVVALVCALWALDLGFGRFITKTDCTIVIVADATIILSNWWSYSLHKLQKVEEVFLKNKVYMHYNKQVLPSYGTDVYPHMPILRPHAARTWQACESQKPKNITIQHGCAGRFVLFWASGRAKFTIMGDSLPCTPMNRRAKFDAARFILGGEIRNCTNKQTNTHKP